MSLRERLANPTAGVFMLRPEAGIGQSAYQELKVSIHQKLLDRVDLQLWVNRITPATLRMPLEAGRMTSATARAIVDRARRAAADRLAGTPWRTNSEVPGPWLRGEGGMHPGGRATRALDASLERGSVTMRGYDRVL